MAFLAIAYRDRCVFSLPHARTILFAALPALSMGRERAAYHPHKNACRGVLSLSRRWEKCFISLLAAGFAAE
ncbi:hypothetical protein CHELA1G11_14054 [Hyphomicrobiales bacterium]|nr:hypothetical protein CHELA1G2_10260 [Hyphomicrobiales bacterium]CAH1675899.1 hypothetical protein CHELA1G11_14054 [Hyphomicrobiales bacterium]